ncbi:MAG: hypothetical protein JNK20_09500 [Flavipsychrobacter sp.]|nr:hypothetical protein [Flavipsychrobacter sp.]
MNLLAIVHIIYPIVGWIGTIAYLLGYLLLSTNKLKSDQVSYHVLNIIGSIGLTTNAVYYTDLSNIVVNVVWGMIAAGAIIVLLRKRSG